MGRRAIGDVFVADPMSRVMITGQDAEKERSNPSWMETADDPSRCPLDPDRRRCHGVLLKGQTPAAQFL
jgi:hypothetical protein